MSKNGVFLLVLMVLVTTPGQFQGSFLAGQDLQDYRIIRINPDNWIVTAQDVQTGEEVKFHIPPAVFKGKTFDAEIGEMVPGRAFRVKAPRNEGLHELKMKTPLLPKTRSMKGMALKPQPPAHARMKMRRGGAARLGWEIISVVPREWIVTARNAKLGKQITFKVNPECFAGFRFKADLRGVEEGKGFSILTPNDSPFSQCCELLEINNP